MPHNPDHPNDIIRLPEGGTVQRRVHCRDHPTVPPSITLKGRIRTVHRIPPERTRRGPRYGHRLIEWEADPHDESEDET